MWEADIGRIAVRGQPGHIVHESPTSTITRAKNGPEVWFKTWNACFKSMMAAALSSNSTPTKKKKKKKNRKPWD
jgi:hypothetical protein